ncbi:MAG: cytidylate kinase family protein [Clostridia bacterium]|nr:cytidylate kinase family protein [Clostridia bacterium]
MKRFRISIAGDIASGKSTLIPLLTERYNAEVISAGKFIRQFAEELGMSIVEFNEYQKLHPEYDKKLDSKVAEYSEIDGDFIFDSRLAWHFVPDSFSVYVKCDLDVAAERMYNANREKEKYESVEKAKEAIISRRKAEVERYKKFYGLDVGDLSNYDLVIDSTKASPEELAEIIIENWKKTNR